MLKMHCSSLSLPSLSSLSLFCVITLFYLVLLFRCKIVELEEPSTTTDDLHSFQVSNVMKWRENAGDSNGKSFGIELTYAIRAMSRLTQCLKVTQK